MKRAGISVVYIIPFSDIHFLHFLSFPAKLLVKFRDNQAAKKTVRIA